MTTDSPQPAPGSLIRIRRLLVTAAALAALAIGVAIDWQARQIESHDPARTGFSSPVAAIEFARTEQDVVAVLGPRERDGWRDGDRMAAIQRLDWWFIWSYVALFAGLVALGTAGRPRWAAVLGVLTVAAIGLAAWFDTGENAAIDGILAGRVIENLDALAFHARAKWALFFAAVLGAGLLFGLRPFERDGPRRLVRWASVLLWFSAAAGAGLFVAPPVVGIAVAAFAAGVVLCLGVAWLRPGGLFDPPPRQEQQAEERDVAATILAKADPLMVLAASVLPVIDAPGHEALAAAYRSRVAACLERAKRPSLTAPDCEGVQPPPRSAGDLPEEVRLELMADALLSDRPEDARRLARAHPALGHDLARDVVRELAQPSALARGGWLARLLRPLRQDPARADRQAALVATLDGAGLDPRQSSETLYEAVRVEAIVNPGLAVRLAGLTGSAVSYATVRHAELDEIAASRRLRLTPPASDTPSRRYAPRRAFDLDLTGLALSGGGIRSATFNLGILQALAELQLLRRFDCLSTVSGGGYIGGWLAAWLERGGGVHAVSTRLSPRESPDPTAPPVRPIRFLREYSNYLAPRNGVFSADTWALIAIWFRNAMLNQMILLLFLGALLLVPRVFGLGTELLVAQSPTWMWLTFAGGVLCLFMVCWRMGSQLRRFPDPDWSRADTGNETTGVWPVGLTGQGAVQRRIVLPAFLCGLLLAIPLWHWVRLPEFAGPIAAGLIASVLFVAGLLVIEMRGGYARAMIRSAAGARRRVGAWVVAVVATVVPAAFGGALIVWVVSLYKGWAPTTLDITVPNAGSWHVVSLGAPLILEVLALSLVLHIGLVGRGIADDRREWWSRLGAWLLIYSAAWIGLFGVAVYGPLLVASLGGWIAAMGGIGWAASSAFGAYLAQDARTAPGGPGPARDGWREWVARIAPYVFAVGLLLLISMGLHLLVIRIARGDAAWVGLSSERLAAGHWWFVCGRDQALTWLVWTLVAVGALVVAAFALALRVDINEFSMHHFYKNRLVRCYLGATRESGTSTRLAHPFTGFDQRDDVALATLRVDPAHAAAEPAGGEAAAPYVGPLPIVNVALNLVKGDDLAWQERKAQSFVFTPLFSGFEYQRLSAEVRAAKGNGGPDPRPTPLMDDGFRPTPLYAYPNGGVHVGTAVAISGAAASPNMGYHSSPAAAFLMTMFNVRLGWWMGNPRHEETWRNSSPAIGLTYLVAELMGSTTNSSRYVNLTDGGHFENLGIYELVRRRCRLIVACDAEEDRRMTFNGLGNAIRKCRTDFGVEIAIAVDRIRGRARRSEEHVAVGEIRYPGGERGTLLYIKASLTGDEPADVIEYRRRRPDFPHQSTADQFFDESQFESYRRLGYHIGRSVLHDAAGVVTGLGVGDAAFWTEVLTRLPRGVHDGTGVTPGSSSTPPAVSASLVPSSRPSGDPAGEHRATGEGAPTGEG
jgi:hypothetical protein